MNKNFLPAIADPPARTLLLLLRSIPPPRWENFPKYPKSPNLFPPPRPHALTPGSPFPVPKSFFPFTYVAP